MPGDSVSIRPATQPGLASPSDAGFLYRVFDMVIDVVAGDTHKEEIGLARKEYEERRGRVFEDEDLWENWTQAFLEWYALERPATQSLGREVGRTPAAEYCGDLVCGDLPVPEGERRDRMRTALRSWLTSYRSLFEIRALAAGRVELVDLLAGGQFSVAEKRAMAGVSVGDVAELRLVGFEGEVLFGRTFCFHPTGTRLPVMGHAERIRAAGGGRLDIVDYCANLRVRCERYRHASPARVYEAPTRDF